MSRQYTSEEIALATKTLEEKGGDIPLVSSLLGIPERTLYTWRKKFLKTAKKVSSPPLPALETPQPPTQPNPFGMTHEEFQKALEAEYVDHPYEDLRQALMADIIKLQPTIAEDPNLAHVRALGISRMIDDVLRLDEICRVEKPQLSIFKYEYHDGTLHDFPPWNNAVHQRAMQAYQMVIAEAKRQYQEQLAEPSAEPSSASDSLAEADELDWDAPAPTLEELIAERFKPDDFIPRHTGIHKYMLEEQPKLMQGIYGNLHNNSQPKAQDDE